MNRSLLAVLLLVGCSSAEEKQRIPHSLLSGVVRIDSGEYSGTGFIIYKKDANTYIATADHVTETFEKHGVQVTFYDRDVYSGQIVGRKVASGKLVQMKNFPEQDVAIFKVPMDLGVVVSLASQEEIDSLRLFQEVLLIGCFLARDPTPSEGLLTGFPDYESDKHHYYRLSVPVSYGGSGGPLFAQFDGQWKVFAISSALIAGSSLESSGLQSLSVPIQYAAFLLEALLLEEEFDDDPSLEEILKKVLEKREEENETPSDNDHGTLWKRKIDNLPAAM